ncbi:hypothetical protein OGR47_06000 [Methylocystis sp. MJC1]|uniref:hypothetical protein n=1 Tax=Methylocystis sp. MJC1 TaxID=2654282 RepID=UPI001FEEB17A|nr:hypothetical protein [Methylocystis sp. MJC1]KAF2992584.1 hypothetical protein MJC1_00162 [Methylocystis sp. MJC1]UZX12997.1 hypothetical protein OGR47_06000 [Methylocystis sp. MJC1]
MTQRTPEETNVLLLRAAALWLLVALLLAFCLVGLNFGVPLLKAIFAGKQSRLVQAHIDYLLMSALIFGFYAARVPLHWSVRWLMVVGAFTNPSLFLLQAIFPLLDSPVPADGLLPLFFRVYLMISLPTATYGFGGGAISVLRSTFQRRDNASAHELLEKEQAILTKTM